MSVTKQLMYPIDFHSICSPTMEVNGVYQLSGYWYSLKYLKKKETTVWNNLRVQYMKWSKVNHFSWQWKGGF